MQTRRKKLKRSLLLYENIAAAIEKQILSEVLKLGEKLPSIRMICRQYAVSMSTALQAYYLLESKYMIESRPQSGYFVCYAPRSWPSLPQSSKPQREAGEQPAEEVIQKVFSSADNKNVTLLSMGVPAESLLPVAKLNKAIMQATRELPGSGTSYESVHGNTNLCRMIARWSFHWNGQLSEKDILTTSGCSNALAYCLMALTQRGDTIAVESPVYFGILQLALNLGLKVIELPTHPETGVQMDALKKVLVKGTVKLCLLVSNFNNPLGSLMPDEHKKETVRLLDQYGIPLIEDDIYGEVYFGNTRPTTCKTYDESGMVLWCSSVSKTLAPGYRVGWVAPGKFFDQVQRIKLFHSLSSSAITQEAIGKFLENGRYENHLRKMRQTLQSNCMQFIRAIGEFFPPDTRVSRPQGGFVLWVELNKKISTLDLFEQAMRHKISIAPGRVFTVQNQFDHCMRLSYGLPWNDKLNHSLKTLGRLTHSLLNE